MAKTRLKLNRVKQEVRRRGLQEPVILDTYVIQADGSYLNPVTSKVLEDNPGGQVVEVCWPEDTPDMRRAYA